MAFRGREVGYTALPTAPAADASLLGRNSRPGDADMTCYYKWKHGDYVIVPDNNKWVDSWDAIMIVGIIWTAFALPLEVAMMDKKPTKMLLVDAALNWFFVGDIVLNFNIAFPSRAGVDPYERAPVKIARHYMALPFSDGMTAGWFWPDLITVVPWDSLTKNHELTKSFKAVRVLRLVRMLRLVRVLRLFNRWHTQFGFSLALVRITRCLGLTLLLVHWLACLWAHIGIFAFEYGQRVGDVSEETWLHRTYLAKHKNIEDFTLFEVYCLALYFMTVVLTTVGFGDVVPMNITETCLMVLTVLLTGLCWAWVVANVVDVIARMDVYAVEFKQTMDDINCLMTARAVGPELQLRIRKHLHEAYSVHQSRHQQQTIKWLSAGLQGELAVESGVEQVCRHISFFKDLDDTGWIIDLAHHMHPYMYSPREFIMDRFSVSVVRKGMLVIRGKPLFRDAVIGEDMILVSEILKDTACPRALTLCEVLSLTRDALVEVCRDFAELNVMIRKSQIRLAVRRAFIAVAKKMDQTHQENQLDGARKCSKDAFGAPDSLERSASGGSRINYSRRVSSVGLEAEKVLSEIRSPTKVSEQQPEKTLPDVAGLADTARNNGWTQCLQKALNGQENDEVARELQGLKKAILAVCNNQVQTQRRLESIEEQLSNISDDKKSEKSSRWMAPRLFSPSTTNATNVH